MLVSHIECYKNHGIDYLRICEAIYVPSLKKQKKQTIKNIGPLSKYDDGKPDFLKRFREQWKSGELEFDGLTYASTLKAKSKNTFEFDNEQNYIELKNLGFIFLNALFNHLGITEILNRIKSESKIEYDFNALKRVLFEIDLLISMQSSFYIS